jgi:hypothetical protein
MFMELVQIGGVEFRGYSGANLTRALISAAYLTVGVFCIAFGYSHQLPYLRMTGIAVLSVGGLIAWIGALKRYRIIADTPTAMLRSAAQGYVELTGTCRAAPGEELLQYGKTPPCLWYMATIIEQNRSFGKRRTRTRFEHSQSTFLLEDGTGECVVDPENAEVQSAHRTSWREGSTYYKVSYLVDGDRIYAIGDMRTLRAADGTLDSKTDLRTLLREWKQDRAALLRRFDTNGDGEIDVQEWQGAVSVAEREVAAKHRQMRLQPGIHILRAPADGRPYLISNRDPEDLRQRYKWWAWCHLTVFVAASVWGLMLLLGGSQ